MVEIKIILLTKIIYNKGIPKAAELIIIKILIFLRKVLNNSILCINNSSINSNKILITKTAKECLRINNNNFNLIFSNNLNRILT